MGFVWVILSKDRALQLDALLRSMERYIRQSAPIYIYYVATDLSHRAAYFEVLKRHSRVISGVVVDIGFRNGLTYLLSGIGGDRISFLVDDQVFVSDVDLKRALIFDPHQVVYSFRLGLRITECQPMGNVEVPLPPFYNIAPPGYLAWRWAEGVGDWACKPSLDGNVFLRSQVLEVLRGRTFNGPQTFEIALANPLLTAEFGVSELIPSVVNLAINRVSSEQILYPSGGQHADVLLGHWVDGFQLDIEAISVQQFSACHAIVDVTLQRRSEL
jgi:hypothetical protein